MTKTKFEVERDAKAEEYTGFPVEKWTGEIGHSGKAFKAGADFGYQAGKAEERERAKTLAVYLKNSLRHAEEYHEGCLYCGVGPIIDGAVTEEHKLTCWWYQAKEALAAFNAAKGGKS